MGFKEFWNDLHRYQKWLFVGFVLTFPGIGLMRFSYNPDVGFEEIGIFGLLFTMIGLIILIFVAFPISIIDWRKGKKRK